MSFRRKKVNVFEAIKKIQVLNDAETDVLAMIEMNTELGRETTFFMEECMKHLINCFKVFFPGAEFHHNFDEQEGRIILFMPESWAPHDEWILDRFMSTLIMRNRHISLSVTMRSSDGFFGI